MSTLEDVKILQQQGMSEDQIITILQNQGVSYREISEALSQTKIKAAVEELPVPSELKPDQTPNQPTPLIQEAFPGMQKSMLKPEFLEEQQEPQSVMAEEYAPVPSSSGYSEEYAGYNQQQGYRQDYDAGYGYQPYEYETTTVSPETITEISEQIISEKMTEIRKHLEKITDFKITIETKTEAIEERLKRIEKIIDSLQSSVLRKVGDYAANIEDIKGELIETQKSFTKLLPEMKKEIQKREHKPHKIHRAKRKTSHKKKQ